MARPGTSGFSISCGVDLIEVERVKYAIDRFGSRFLDRVFTPLERSDCDGRLDSAQSYAARFAAKEACLKALRTGLSRGVRLRDVEVVNDESGAPLVAFHGEARKRLGRGVPSVSLSHTDSLAVAHVVILFAQEAHDD